MQPDFRVIPDIFFKKFLVIPLVESYRPLLIDIVAGKLQIHVQDDAKKAVTAEDQRKELAILA